MGQDKEYHESMDLLLTVWKKLGIRSHKSQVLPLNHFQEKKWKVVLYKKNLVGVGVDLNFKLAAAYATSEAIKRTDNKTMESR